MKKVPYSYIVLTLQMVIITFFVIILSSVTLTADSQSFLNNKMFTSNVQGLSVKNNDLNLYTFADSVGSNAVVYKYLSEESQIKRAVYCSSDVLGFSEYIEIGRFFSKEDCRSELPLAVIGNNVLSDTIEENGEMYYGHNETLYRVIGVFKKTNSDLDRAVYLNLSYVLGTSGSAGTYYIDSEDLEHSVQTRDLAAKYTEGTVFEYEQPQNDMNVSHKIKFALAVIAAFCNLLMTAHYFILKQKYKIAVKKLCGYTNKSMMFKYVRNISMITILAYTIGSGLAVLLTRVTLSFSESQFSVSSFAAALIIVVMTAVIVTCQLIANSAKVNISSVLKG